MFEKVISDLLNQSLSSFIQITDKKQLDVGLFSGELELNNMKLKTDIFDDSPVPFKLLYGQVGKIFFQIPYLDLFNKSVVIEITDIFGFV